MMLYGDGVLDADELALRNAAKDKAASDVRVMDTNKDGFVDEGEFIAGGGKKEDFDKYDRNGDGVLDAGELEDRAADQVEGDKEKRAAAKGQEAVRKMDTNK